MGEMPAPAPVDSALMKKSRAQPPEDTRKKPVLGKLGTLFAAGRRRNTRNGSESSTSSNTKPASPKDLTSSNAPARASEKSKGENHQPKPPDPSEDSSSQETQGEGGVQATSGDAAAEMSPCSPSAQAGQPGHDCDSPQLEPLQAEGERFPDATTAAKQPHSSAPNCSGRESEEAHARHPGEDAGHPQEAARGSPTREKSEEGRGEVPEAAPDVGACGGHQPPEDACGQPAPGERAHPSKVLTLDIHLCKTEVAPADEPVRVAPAAEEDFGDSDDMDRKSSGRRSGRRRRSQKSTDSPGADAGPPESAARDDAVFDDEVAPDAVPGSLVAAAAAERKVKSPRAAPDGGVTSAAGPRAQLRGEPERCRPAPAATSPTKRKGRSRVPDAGPSAPAGGPCTPAKESPPKRASAPDPGSGAKGSGAADGGEDGARVIPRELTVKSSSLLPEIKPEHKRGPLPSHFEGRGRELGRATGPSDPEGLKPRNQFGVGRSTVTTKVTLPARPKNVELNLKTPKNLDSSGNEHNSFSQPVHKGNTANKISLFENKRMNSTPRHPDVRHARNIPPSNKTFVGRAKLNLAKKAKEMEQLEKKMVPNGQQNGVLEKEPPAETKAHLLPVTEGAGRELPESHTLAPQPNQGGEADVQTDAGCVSEPEAPSPVPIKNPVLSGEDDSEAADSKRLVLNAAQESSAIVDTKDSPPEPQNLLCDSQPPSESCQGPSLPLVDIPQDGCAQVAVSHLCPNLQGSESHNGCTLPSSPHTEQVPPSAATAGEDNPPLSPEHSSETVGHEAPSKVLVQVRSFVLPAESTQDVSTQIISESSEVREAQLPSCHSNELEVVSVTSCDPQREEVTVNKSTSPTDTTHTEELVVEPGSLVVPPESARSLTTHAPNHSIRIPLSAEASSPNLPRARTQSEMPPRPNENVVNGQDSPAGHLNISAASDDSVFDSSSDMEKFTEIIKNMDSVVCVPQKKKKARMPNSPAPHFAMPPIHEDNLEKVLDPNVFTFGLGRKKESLPELSPALHLMDNLDPKSKLRPKRASADQSILFKSLHSNGSGKSEPQATPKVSDKGSREVSNGGVKRSRLEKSTLFSSMLSSLPQEKVFSPSVTSVNTMTTSFSTSQSPSLSRSSGTQPRTEGATPCASDKEQPHPAPHSSIQVFNFTSSSPSCSSLKSSSHMEKYPPKEETKEEVNSRSNLHLPEMKFSDVSKPRNHEGIEKANHMESALKPHLPNHGNGDADFMGLFKPSRYDPGISFSGMSLPDSATLRGSLQSKLNPRPGKVVIFSEPEVSEECIEVFGDIQDCSSWSLSPVILVKVVRGCWILYEKPNFEGHSVPLEEGELELSGLWSVEDILERNQEAETDKPVVIGSIRHVVQDYRISQIDLFTEPEGLGLLNSYFDDTEEMQGFGVMQKTCSIKVHWGTWLIYEEPGFQGVPFILEPGEYPDLSFWDTEEAYIGSMRPLKMGGRKVEFPTDPKVIIYEKPLFEGKCMELETEICSFLTEGGEAEETTGNGHLPFTSVGSMKVLRGIWVAYEKPGFTGHQYLLEEGEYKDWKDWGGYNGELQSLRPILGDFSNAHMIMYSEKNFGSKSSSIDVLGIVADLKETGYGVKTQSIHVLSGVWVAYENPDFTGEQYILDKGLYTSFEDWGGKNCKISSVQPICLDSFAGPRRRNQVHLFSEPQFQGQSQSFEETTSQIDDSFSTKSCRILGGSWVAYDGENFSGNQYVLEEGHYPCLSAMGLLPGTTFKSLRFIDVEFSEPAIILFERENFKGKKIELNAETVNLQSLGFNTQIRSVQVIGGIWITYEFGNYRGRQFLLSPAEVPNWYEFSGCRQIGSLRPFAQKRIYFRLRNKTTGLFLSTNGNLDDLKLLRIQVMEDVGADDQIWIYQEGCIKCRIAEDCCLTTVGSLVTSGSKLGLALDQNADCQFWCMKSDGRIYSKLKPNLVLDIKGGAQYDQNHIILNTVNQEKLTQVWEAMVL
ncbi:beta/gamma crystallin domain-containing protein 1 [Thomomys bottae]